MGLHLIDDVETILHFSEFGVVLLLFLIELELNPSRLWNLGHAIFGLGALQVVITTGVISAIGVFFINDLKVVFVIAIALALSSTAMAMQIVNGKNLTHTGAGQSGFAVLLFQDLAVILLLALMPLMAHQTGSSSQAAPMSLVHIVCYRTDSDRLALLSTTYFSRDRENRIARDLYRVCIISCHWNCVADAASRIVHGLRDFSCQDGPG